MSRRIATRSALGRRLAAAALATGTTLGLLVVGPAAASARPAEDPAVTTTSAGAAASTASGTDAAGTTAATTLILEDDALRRGAQVVAHGTGWPADTLVQVELCGRRGTSSSDCDVTTSRSIATFPDGRLEVDLLVTAPPVPCPCVLRAFVPGSDVGVRAPVTIEGMAVERADETPAVPVRRLDVTDVTVRSVGVGLWSRAREVRVAVRNTGDTPLDRVGLRVRWGAGEDTDRFVAMDPLPRLAAGATAEVRGRFDLDAFTYGSFRVDAAPSGVQGEAASASTSAPVFEVVVAVLAVLAAVALFVFRAVRRRRGPGGDASEVEDDETAAEPSVDSTSAPFAGVGSRSSARALVALGLAGALTIGAAGCSGSSKKASSKTDVCAVLKKADPGNSIGGDDLVRLVTSVKRIGSITDPPKEISGAVAVLSGLADANSAAMRLPDLELGDDGYAEAYQAAYRLRFGTGLRTAAALIEEYGVGECGLVRSGKLELPTKKIEQAAAPQATLPDQPIATVEIDLADPRFDDAKLPALEIPPVTFDQDLGQFRLEDPKLVPPDLSDQRKTDEDDEQGG